MIDPDESLIRRKLSFMETNMALMHEQANGTTQGVISLLIDGCVDHHLFNSAVSRVFQTFSILRCTVIEFKDGLHFYENAVIENIICDPVNVTTKREWMGIEEQMAHIPIIARDNLWTARLVYSQDRCSSKIIFVSHHALFDAQGAVTVLNALLSYLDCLLLVSSSANIHSNIAPSLDSFLTGRVPGAIATPSNNPAPYLKPHDLWCDMSSRSTCYFRVKIDNDVIHNIRSYCVKESLSEQSLISAAYVLAILDANAEAPNVYLKTAVALREILLEKGNAKELVGCYLAITEALIYRNDRTIVDIAKSIQIQNLDYVVEQCLHKTDFTLTALRDRIKSLCENHHFVGYGVTNVGKLPLAACQGFPVEELRIFTNRVIGNYAITLQIMEFEEFMAFDFIYVSPLIASQSVENIANLFRESVRKIGEQNTFGAEAIGGGVMTQ